MGDLLWMTAKAQYKDFSLLPFSDYDDLLEGKKASAEVEKERLANRVEEMLNMYT